MRKLFDKELLLRCSGGNPFDYIIFAYVDEGLHIGFRAFYGSFRQRLKRAIDLIFSGYLDAYPDWICYPDNEVKEASEKIKEFLNEIEKEKGE